MEGALSGGTLFVSMYLLLMLAVGVFVSKWIKDTSDFLISGRELNWLVLGITISAIQMAGTTSQFVPTDGFNLGWGAIWGSISFAIMWVFMGYVFMEFWRRSGAYNTTEWLEARFGNVTRVVVVISFIVGVVFVAMAQFVGAGMILSTWLGWPYWLAAFLVGAVTLAYCTSGGLWGATGTSLIQFAWMAIVPFIALPLWLFKAYGPPTVVLSNLPPTQSSFPFGTLRIAAWTLPSFTGYLAMYASLLWAAPWNWQKGASARSEKDAKLGPWVVLVFITIYAVVMSLSGMYMKALKPETSPPAVFGTLMSTMPPILAAFLMVTIAAASQSTADAVISGGSVMLTRDVIQRVRRNLNSKQLLRASRWSLFVIASIAVVIAMVYSKGALLALAVGASFIGSALPPMLGAIWWPGCRKEGAVLGILGGVIVGLYTGVFTDVGVRLISPVYAVPIASGILMFLGSILVKVTGPWWHEDAEENFYALLSKTTNNDKMPSQQPSQREINLLNIVAVGRNTLGDIVDSFNIHCAEAIGMVSSLVKKGLLTPKGRSGLNVITFDVTSNGLQYTSFNTDWEINASKEGLGADDVRVLAAVALNPNVDVQKLVNESKVEQPRILSCINNLNKKGFIVYSGFVRRKVNITKTGEQVLNKINVKTF